MLMVVVTVFAICWLPLHAFILLIDFRPDLTEYENISQKHFFVAVYSAVHWLAMSNSCVNPIIYGFLHDSFRVCHAIVLFILFVIRQLFMAALWNTVGHYIFALWLLLSSVFVFSSPNLSGRRLDVYHT